MSLYRGVQGPYGDFECIYCGHKLYRHNIFVDVRNKATLLCNDCPNELHLCVRPSWVRRVKLWRILLWIVLIPWMAYGLYHWDKSPWWQHAISIGLGILGALYWKRITAGLKRIFKRFK